MTQVQTVSDAKAELLATAERLGLTMTAKFVPFSQSRNRAEKTPSLNWLITILRDGREVLTTDYMAGCAHAPSYKQMDRSLGRAELVAWECEHGKRGVPFHGGNTIMSSGQKPLMPDLADVLHSLTMDADVLDYATFEDWAAELGYDADSRRAEKTYRACLNIALKLNNAIGSNGLAELREAGQDY